MLMALPLAVTVTTIRPFRTSTQTATPSKILERSKTSLFRATRQASRKHPVVTAFTIPSTSTSLTVPITKLTATDNAKVAGYMLTVTAIKPKASAAGWTAAKPTNYTFPTAGAKKLFAWAKDRAGLVSAGKKATVTITLAAAAPAAAQPLHPLQEVLCPCLPDRRLLLTI